MVRVNAAPDNAELEIFLSTTRSFIDREASISQVRELHRQGKNFERDWWRRAANLGWTSLLVPEELGGGSASGDGVSDLTLVMQQLGGVVAPGPLIPVSVVLAGLAGASTSASFLNVISALVDGSAVATWAIDEPGTPFGSSPSTRATEIDGGYRLDGVKDRVETACDCDFFMVTARADDGVMQFVVGAADAGVDVEEVASVDLVRGFGTVRFNGVEVPREAAVGTAAEAAHLISRQSQVAQLLQCAEIVGALDAVFGMTVSWVQDRHSFGRPLASYQALKHRLADMKMQLEASRAILDRAVREVASRSASAAVVVSAAKAYVGEYSVRIAQDCVQLHGGIGVTWEHDLHVFLRRIEVNRALYGTTEEHYERVYAHFDEMGTAL
ncbi:acyl-CoA dehydrogenase family protein [Mycobacterium sp. UM_CSW]|uniref:acyl-CoA dehydrogenase family protein n=1 Tax=Mycobacterium sp. UM_CSW TaxID=1370119 RepID=UPI0004248599|nr:acyl-CoA dehydrogenase family protein [Mycobacterium sp. UM_CSW]